MSIHKAHMKTIAYPVGGLEKFRRYVIYTTSKLEEIEAHYEISDVAAFEEAVREVAETSPMGFVDAAYYCVGYFQCHGYWPNEYNR